MTAMIIFFRFVGRTSDKSSAMIWHSRLIDISPVGSRIRTVESFSRFSRYRSFRYFRVVEPFRFARLGNSLSSSPPEPEPIATCESPRVAKRTTATMDARTGLLMTDGAGTMHPLGDLNATAHATFAAAQPVPAPHLLTTAQPPLAPLPVAAVAEEPKRKRGRPKKVVTEGAMAAAVVAAGVKRKRGRPRKGEEPVVKRGPGRPRTSDAATPKAAANVTPKRKPGRPRKEDQDKVTPGRGPGVKRVEAVEERTLAVEGRVEVLERMLEESEKKAVSASARLAKMEERLKAAGFPQMEDCGAAYPGLGE